MTTEGLRERNKRRRAQRILEAARELLRADPDTLPGAERIAQRAEVAPATVFNLIGPRERLWAALADDLLADIGERLARLDVHDPHERARRIVATTAQRVSADPQVHRAVLAHWQLSGRLVRRDLVDAIAGCIRDAQASGVLRADADAAELAALVATGCTGAAHQWAANILSDRGLRERCVALVDLAFAAAAA